MTTQLTIAYLESSGAFLSSGRIASFRKTRESSGSFRLAGRIGEAVSIHEKIQPSVGL
jgi:hypothetical protein